MARPVWTPTDTQRRQAETMAAYGIPEADIARVLGVSKPTLRKHCGTELDTGATRANSKVADFVLRNLRRHRQTGIQRRARPRHCRDLLDEDARRLERNQHPQTHRCGER